MKDPIKRTYDRYFKPKRLRELSALTRIIEPGHFLSVQVLGATLLHLFKKMDAYTEVNFLMPLTPPSSEAEVSFETAKYFLRSQPRMADEFEKELGAVTQGNTLHKKRNAKAQVIACAYPLMLAVGKGVRDPIAMSFFSRALQKKRYRWIVQDYPEYKEFQYQLARAIRPLNSTQFLFSFFEAEPGQGIRSFSRKDAIRSYEQYILNRFGKKHWNAIVKLQKELEKLF